MRVLLVTVHLRCGGAERVMSWLAARLDALGHEVTLATWFLPIDDFYALPPGVARVGVRDDTRQARFQFHVDRVRFIRRIRQLAKDADVVLAFLPDANVATLLATIGLGVPVVVSERNHPVWSGARRRSGRLGGWLVRWRAAAFVVQSADIAEAFRLRWGITGAVVIPNAPAIAIAAATHRGPVVLSVGRLVEAKDHATLIRAWARVASTYPQWTLRIIGEGPLKQALGTMVQQLGLEHRVEIIEPRVDIGTEFQAASIFVLPSVTEGFPNALLEAAASGCACIATDCPGASADIVDHGSAGLLVPVGDHVALAAALESLVGDAGQREELGEAARVSAGRFDADTVVGQWVQVLSHAQGAGVLRT
ncbi:MAG: glycosyltransferase [Actinobacteria bacterium]|uniref:Unannotated protein n=1 Tax=freshwater metagenome TaxID=449393 RepID=A0A6J7J554_9ZZZZ|nr:glycosyltransferase [Actinomycetota bacterium]